MGDKSPLSSAIFCYSSTMISMHQADRVLLGFARVAPEHETRFLERLRQLRRFGVPSGVPKGRGVSSGRTLEQLLETALAIQLLDAGLASSDVARLVREEWVLARSVLMLFDPRLADTKWPDGKPQYVYWVAVPAGLASYRSAADEQNCEPQLKTLMLFEGEELELALRELIQDYARPLVVIRAADVLRQLGAAFRATTGTQLVL
jgi:hypothetical protein